MNKLQQVLCRIYEVEEVDFYDPQLGISTAIEEELHHTVDPTRLFKAIEEYAELYAMKCLIIASKEAVLDVEWNGEVESDRCEYTSVIDRGSIVHITLPSHE